jgi:hypothetical protein
MTPLDLKAALTPTWAGLGAAESVPAPGSIGSATPVLEYFVRCAAHNALISLISHLVYSTVQRGRSSPTGWREHD